MVETPDMDVTPVSPGATVVEPPEKTPLPSEATSVEEPVMPAGGTYIEPVSTPTERPKETQVEPEPVSSPPPRQTTAAQTGAGATGVGTGSTTAGVSGTGSGPAATPSSSGTGRKILGMSLPVLVGGVIGVACLLGVGVFGISRILGGLGASPATEEPVALVANTETPTEAAAPEPTVTQTVPPTATPTETPIPPTPTPDTPYVLITDITLDSNTYVVDYEVHNYPSDSPNMHVHMFFDTVPPEQAGAPGSGPWKLTWGPYGDPPFTQYGVSNKPAGATQMCALVANPNHSIQMGSGNCMDLPEN